jgi:Domain of unknown function (DUF4062)/inactive STAND
MLLTAYFFSDIIFAQSSGRDLRVGLFHRLWAVRMRPTQSFFTAKKLNAQEGLMSISVFLSSTAKDLYEYREEAHRAIEGLDGYHCVRMETFGARAWNASDFCRAKVGECDLFIGIVGHLHGSSPRNSEQSFTELEYDAAVDYDKPRLMFLAPKNFNVPNDLIDEELELDGTKRAKQKAFRQRVSNDHIWDTFHSPEDLGGRIRQAIHNWEQQEKQKDQRPNLGPLVPHTCDRTDQEAEFRKHFASNLSSHPGFPQIYVIHGQERESHGSLVERFRATTIQEHADHRWGEQKATVSLWDVDWPEAHDLSSRKDRLRAWLFERLDPLSPIKENYDYSELAFRLLLSSTLNSIVILQHDISAKTWDRTTIELMEWYLQFWDDVKGAASIPQCLVFLNIIYPHVPKVRPWSFLRLVKRLLQKRRNRYIQAQLQAICNKRKSGPRDGIAKHVSPCVMIQELTCVKLDDVMRWFRRHKIGKDDGEREQKCKEIFIVEGGFVSDCRNMRDIEHALNRIHQRTVRRRVEV